MNKFEKKALLYAEKYGIIDFEVKGNEMIYYETFYSEGTYKAIVDLDTLKENRSLVQ